MPTPRDRRRAWLATVALVARAARLPIPVPAIPVTIGDRRHRVALRSHTELAGAVEVLCAGNYVDALGHRGVRRVLDLGANVGFATILFAARYRQAQVVAVEPAPDTFARLRRSVAGLPNVRALQLAVGAPGIVSMDLSVPSTERRAADGAGVQLRRVTLSELLDELGWEAADILKIDVEGDEYDVRADPAARRTRVIVGELHTRAAPARFPGVPALLPDHDVRVAKRGDPRFPLFTASLRPPPAALRHP